MKKFIVFIAFIAFISPSHTVFGQESITNAKSIFIYNFTRLMDWGKNSNDFVICVYMDKNLYSDLKKYTEDKKVGDQHINVVFAKSLDDLSNVNILYAGKSKYIQAFKDKIDNSKICVITDEESKNGDFAINFVVEDDKLKYEVRKSELLKHHIIFNSFLLKSAIQVI